MRETGKSFRVLMQALYVASKSKQDVILWVGNQNEVSRVARLLKETAKVHFGHVLSGPDRVVLPFGPTVYIKNIGNVDRELRGFDFRRMQELVDGVDEDFTLNDFYAYRQRHGLV